VTLGRSAVLRYPAILILLTTLLLLLTGCGHPKQARVNVPPPPKPAVAESPAAPPVASTATIAPVPGPKNRNERSFPDIEQPTIPPGPPLATEIGRASWYGPPYHNRRGSNGEIYDMNAMTAAHRTLPLGSIVRVTNLKTGHTAMVRITDRGPFIRGRVLDLSLAAARKVDVYQPGVAEVKLEVMQTPVPIETGGKWAVQIGGFSDEDAATNLADHLTRRYHTAKVQRFNSPVGRWWVLVRVPGDDRQRAQELAAETQTPEGGVFMVRLD
jgi:rare lipoprotein A